jgi:hypothetical protein
MKINFLPCLKSSEGHGTSDPATDKACMYFTAWVNIEPDEGVCSYLCPLRKQFKNSFMKEPSNIWNTDIFLQEECYETVSMVSQVHPRTSHEGPGGE